jgi:glycerol transport system ATP-binding protein
MHDGEVVQTGTPEALFEHPAHTFVGHFIGSPRHEPAALHGRGPGGHARPARQRIALARAYAGADGQRIELGIRPEFLTSRGEGLPVRVRARIEDLGRAPLARVELSGHALRRVLPEGMAVGGDEAALILDPAGACLCDGHLVKGGPGRWPSRTTTAPGSWSCRSWRSSPSRP